MNNVMSDWEYSSLKQNLRRTIASLSEAMRGLDSLKRDADYQIREIKYSESAIEQAWEGKLKEEVRKAGAKTTGYSSYGGYSSYDGKIRDSRRIIERCLDKVSDIVSNMCSVKAKIDALQRDIERKFETLSSAYESADRKLSDTSKKLETASRQSDVLSKEKDAAARQARDNERRLRSEVEAANRKATIASAAAAAAAAGASTASLEVESVGRKLQSQQLEWERKISEMKAYYEGEIADLKDMVPSVDAKQPINSGSQLDQIAIQIEETLARFEAIASDDEICEKDDAVVQTLTPEQMSVLASDYAILWNGILDDDIIEMSEVERIKDWCRKFVLHLPEGSGLFQVASKIVSRGQVEPIDAQSLYDRSFMLLKALGAELDEPSVDEQSGMVTWKGKTQLAKAIASRGGNEGAFGGILHLFSRKRPCSKDSKWRKPLEDAGIKFDDKDLVIEWSVAKNPL